MTSTFEDRLLTELRRVVAERPAPAAVAVPRRRSRLALSGAAVAAATAAIVVVATSGDNTPSDTMFVANPSRESATPGGAPQAVMRSYVFLTSQVFYPSAGCWQITTRQRTNLYSRFCKRIPSALMNFLPS